ncbi:MAG: thrombospondin type 3 repeat-containing protein [Verrucomicrobiota bacterium]
MARKLRVEYETGQFLIFAYFRRGAVSDNDGDGINDAVEYQIGTDPTKADSTTLRAMPMPLLLPRPADWKSAIQQVGNLRYEGTRARDALGVLSPLGAFGS